jgi:L-asparagine transporter-like permease
MFAKCGQILIGNISIVQWLIISCRHATFLRKAEATRSPLEMTLPPLKQSCSNRIIFLLVFLLVCDEILSVSILAVFP